MVTRPLRSLLAAATFSIATLAGGTAAAQGRVDVDKARAAYLARSFTEAEERLRLLVDPNAGLKDLSLLSQARMYLAAVLLARGKREDGAELFQKLIVEDPVFEPDPLSFPGEVINTFYDVRVQLQEKLRQAAENAARLEADRRRKAEEERRRQEAWLAKVKQMATEEKVTIKNSRWVALVPFGAGQFQNRDPLLGWTFLVSEAALVAGTMVTVPLFNYADGRAHGQGADVEGKAAIYKDRADTIRIVNLSFVGALAALAITGVVQANLAFIPAISETKKRPLPPLAWLAPTLAPTPASDGNAAPTGVVVGVRGAIF